MNQLKDKFSTSQNYEGKPENRGADPFERPHPCSLSCEVPAWGSLPLGGLRLSKDWGLYPTEDGRSLFCETLLEYWFLPCHSVVFLGPRE